MSRKRIIRRKVITTSNTRPLIKLSFKKDSLRNEIYGMFNRLSQNLIQI